MTAEKQCSRCGEVKPLDAFHVQAQKADGHHAHCADCRRRDPSERPPRAGTTNVDWMEQAKCRGVDPDLFFPPRGGMEQLADAREVCRGCVVREDCLEYAIANGEKWGVWGGLSERERRRMRRRRRLVA